MSETMLRIRAVDVDLPYRLGIVWLDGSTSDVDLDDWIESGSALLASLRDAEIFARASVGAYGGNVTWDGDEGDLAIDSLHLKRLADQQAGRRAAA